MGSILAGSYNAVPVFPSTVGTIAGGMVYRPRDADAGEASEASRAHTPTEAGSTPAPATNVGGQPLGKGQVQASGTTTLATATCSVPTKDGYECLGAPSALGICASHTRAVGRALDSLWAY